MSVFIWIVPGNDESGEPLSVDPADVFVAIRWDGKRGPRQLGMSKHSTTRTPGVLHLGELDVWDWFALEQQQ